MKQKKGGGKNSEKSLHPARHRNVHFQRIIIIIISLKVNIFARDKKKKTEPKKLYSSLSFILFHFPGRRSRATSKKKKRFYKYVEPIKDLRGEGKG